MQTKYFIKKLVSKLFFYIQTNIQYSFGFLAIWWIWIKSNVTEQGVCSYLTNINEIHPFITLSLLHHLEYVTSCIHSHCTCSDCSYVQFTMTYMNRVLTGGKCCFLQEPIKHSQTKLSLPSSAHRCLQGFACLQPTLQTGMIFQPQFIKMAGPDSAHALHRNWPSFPHNGAQGQLFIRDNTYGLCH